MRPSIRFAVSICLFLALIGGGAFGYSFIEGWSVSDSLYMTMITITTVGYGEVQSLSQNGRTFTIFLLLVSIAIAGYSVSTLISFIFEGQFVEVMRGRRQRTIAHLSDHYIICGCGVVGKEVALEFQRSGVPFVIVEKDAEGT